MYHQPVSSPHLPFPQGTPDLPEAFAIMGFAFYCQPMLLPLLHEMPRGPRGLKLTSRATAIAIFVVANVVFGVLGFFGAARYGLDTQGNVLVNAWIGGRGEGVLDLVMTAYLAVSAVIVQVRGPGLLCFRVWGARVGVLAVSAAVVEDPQAGAPALGFPG